VPLLAFGELYDDNLVNFASQEGVQEQAGSRLGRRPQSPQHRKRECEAGPTWLGPMAELEVVACILVMGATQHRAKRVSAPRPAPPETLWLRKTRPC
jgi:hypothetical protein